MAYPRLDDATHAAIAASHLGALPPDVVARLLTGASTLRIPGRSTIADVAADFAHVDLVVAGVVRVQVLAPDGRAMTVRYCRAGALLGVATLYADVERPFSIQALTDAELLRLRPSTVRQWANRDPRVARALLAETSERVLSFIAEFSGHAFANVRQRIARHLLDLASDDEHPDELVARISQQELADAVGTAREVVVRALRELRAEGAIETGRHGIVIRDAARLSSIGQRPGTKVPDAGAADRDPSGHGD